MIDRPNLLKMCSLWVVAAVQAQHCTASKHCVSALLTFLQFEHIWPLLMCTKYEGRDCLMFVWYALIFGTYLNCSWGSLQDYHWWWRSYLTSGSSAIYLMLYSSFYFYTKLDISKPVPTMLYFGYMFIVSYSFFILTGTIGFVSTFFFVRAIYASVKID